MEEHYFETRGLAYRTNIFVPGRLTLVFVHGLSSSASAWLPYEQALENEYNIVTYDQRGHGISKRYKKYDDYALDLFVSDLHELLGVVGVGPYVLVSHSFGTLVALAYLQKWQSEVKAAVFIAPEYNVARPFLAKVTKILLAPVPLMSYLPFFPGKGGRIDYGRFVQTGDWNIFRLCADVRNTGLRAYLYCAKQSYALNATHFLKNIFTPVLLVHGTKDSIFPFENSVYMSTHMPHASLAAVEGANHIVVLNRPREVIATIQEFARTNI